MDYSGKKRFDYLSNIELPSPNHEMTKEICASDGHISVVAKSDGTFALRNEITGEENGHFLRKEEALQAFNDITSE